MSGSGREQHGVGFERRPGNATSDEARDGLAGQRARLVGIAYHLLGSVAEAEDVVQDVAERWARADTAAVADPEAWLVTVTTRRCLDLLRSAARRREAYVGPWLPEPAVAAGEAGDPAAEVALAETVSYALLVVLEELSPPERIAFVLHDVFGEPFDRVATLLGRTPAAARQLASRARRRARAAAPGHGDGPTADREVTEAFLAAARGGDREALVRLLAPQVVLTSDGGGIVTAARRPIEGADRVARFLVGLATRAGSAGEVVGARVNDGPGALLRLDGALIGVAALDVRDGRVQAVHVIVNPRKLGHVPATPGARPGRRPADGPGA